MMDVQRCNQLGIGVGIKLVRGAYIQEEKEWANKNGGKSPCWDNIDQTHRAYN